jgi:hypothetical protein
MIVRVDPVAELLAVLFVVDELLEMSDHLLEEVASRHDADRAPLDDDGEVPVAARPKDLRAASHPGVGRHGLDRLGHLPDRGRRRIFPGRNDLLHDVPLRAEGERLSSFDDHHDTDALLRHALRCHGDGVGR